MVVEWSIEGDGAVLHLRSGPRFSTGDLRNALLEAIRHPDARPPLCILWDNRGSEEAASHDEILRRTEFVVAHPDEFAKTIAVVVDDRLHYGLARIASSYADNRGTRIAVFEEVQAAREWLEKVIREKS